MLPFLLLKRWKAVGVFFAAMGGYLAVTWLVGLHPFLLRFGREPGLDAFADEIAEIATCGNIPSLLPHVPSAAWNALLAAALSTALFRGVRAISAEFDDARRLRVASALMTDMMMVFLLLNRMTYSYYLIPVFPLMCLLAQDEDWLPRRWRALAVAWTFLFAFKDMFNAGCEFNGFMAGCQWARILFSFLCVATTASLIALNFFRAWPGNASVSSEGERVRVAEKGAGRE
jgi:hypothetical protein